MKSETPAARAGLPLARIVAGAVVVVGLVLLGRRAGGYIPQFAAWVESHGVWGPVVFILGYSTAVVAFVPASLLTLAAGAIFGIVEGTIVVFVAATLGSAAAFLISRYVARSAVERRIAANPRFAAIDRAVGAQGFKMVALLRLSPVFPFNVLNYGLGLTKVRFADYLLASFAMLPATLLFVYYGKLAGDVAALAGGAAVRKDAAYYVLLGVGLVATAVVTTLVTRVATRAIREATET
jgi:uncharacterized membrane protein YdjX (TVP38/TMEM64 family)